MEMNKEPELVRKLKIKMMMLLLEGELYGYSKDDEVKKQMALQQLSGWIDSLVAAGTVKEDGENLCQAWLVEARDQIGDALDFLKEHGLVVDERRKY